MNTPHRIPRILPILALCLAAFVIIQTNVTVAVDYAIWTFNDGTGTDSSGNGHDLGGSGGTLVASPPGWGPSASCKFNTNGSSYARWGAVPGAPMPTDDFVLSMHVKGNRPAYTAGTASSLFATDGDNNGSLWIGSRDVDGTNMWEVTVRGTSFLARFPVTPNTAQHIEVSRVAGVLSVKCDGVDAGVTSSESFVWGSCHVGVNAMGGTSYSGFFGDITVVSPVLEPSFVDITNITGTVFLPDTISSIAIAGTNSEFTMGDIWWTNSLGGNGIVPADPTGWTFNVTLAPGANIITVRGTNAAGYVASDTVTANVVPGSAKDILAFGLPGNPAVMAGTDITLTVPYGTDVTTLAPDYTVSPLATGNPPSGTPMDFFTPQTYTVTAYDSSTQAYTVAVVVAPPITIYANWTYNDGTGADSSGNGHNLGGLSGGTVVASPPGWGSSTNCLFCTNGNSYARWGTIPGDPMPTNNFVLSMYVKGNRPAYTAGTASSLFATDGDATGSLWIGSRDVDGTNMWEVTVRDSAFLVQFPVTPDTVQHIEVICVAGVFSVKLDGVDAGTPTAAEFHWNNCHVGINSGGGSSYSGFFGDITMRAPDLAYVEITNIPAMINVPFGTASYTIAGTNNEFTVGDLWWSNSLGGDGVVAAGMPAWTFTVGLVTGTNVITVSGSNAFGMVYSDSARVNVVPEPAGVALFVIGYSLLVRAKRRSAV